jgi:ubiquinone/menaquinone biosynthesis C-methylase UbiE
MEMNLEKNKHHYDFVYGNTQVQRIIDRARNYDAFLDDALKTDTSWHGMYQNNFRNCLMGKKVLELGAGDGMNSVIMALLGAEVIATDISDGTMIIIEEVNNQVGTEIQTRIGDLNSLQFQEESFDFVIGKAFLHHLTHNLERDYLCKTAKLLKKEGEARFFEPAVNSKLLDTIRWMVPVPGRSSSLMRSSFQAWKEKDPHPIRDNSSEHFQRVGSLYFSEIQIVLIGSIERLCRLLPAGNFNRRFRRWAHRLEPLLPGWFRYFAARSQLIVYRRPHSRERPIG